MNTSRLRMVDSLHGGLPDSILVFHVHPILLFSDIGNAFRSVGIDVGAWTGVLWSLLLKLFYPVHYIEEKYRRIVMRLSMTS